MNFFHLFVLFTGWVVLCQGKKDQVRTRRSDSFEINASDEDKSKIEKVSKGVLTNQIADIIGESSEDATLSPKLIQTFSKTFETRDDTDFTNSNKRQITSHDNIDDQNESDQLKFDYQCTACNWGAEILFKYHKMGWPPGNMIKTLSSLCATFKIQSETVCDGIVKSVGQQLFAVLDLANDTVSPSDLCGMVYGGDCALRSKRLNGWFLDIPDLKVPPPTPQPDWPNGPTESIEKILHLSDTHIQLDYAEGMYNECQKPICCSPVDGKATVPQYAAGPFGDYNCDLPRWTFEEILRQAQAEHPDAKYIILTGDFPAHDIWRQNRTLNIESVKTVIDLLKKYFPDAKLFPAIGNHESFPVNMFPDPSLNGSYSPSWLYSNMAEIYQPWLSRPSQQRSLKNGGYYTVLMRPNLRVISINTNFCNNLNFWLLLNFADPHNHLHWVYKQLHKAEVNKEKVFILGHIPPGTESCLDRWSREYNRLVYRFRNTIIGQFFGHTHLDEFELFFAPTPSQDGSYEPVSVAYLAPSQTPHDGLNPAYRIYTIDGDYPGSSHMILDHSTYWMNLTAANEKTMVNGSIPESDNLKLKLEYSAKEAFGLENLSPKSWSAFVNRMLHQDSEFDKFRRFYSRSGPFYAKTPCPVECQEQLICSLVTSRHSDLTHCKKIKSELASKNVVEEPISWLDYFWLTGSHKP